MGDGRPLGAVTGMRILITGGFGFVGGRLVEHLSLSGHQILIASRQRQEVLDLLPMAVTVQTDWDDENALEQICCGVDVVIHAAGMNAKECASRPPEALMVNGVATARLVEAAGRAGVQSFCYLSTAHVYASPLVGIITEESYPRNLHPYATSHLAGEQAVLHAAEQGRVRGLVLRLSNAFGSPVRRDANCWTLLVNDLCRQAVETRKLVLKTSGLQQRDFIDLSSVCRIVEHTALEKGARETSGILNIGSGVSQSVLDMANLIRQRCTRVLGFEPLLERWPNVPHKRHLPLEYRIERLASLGLKPLPEGLTNEIDHLLSYCQSIFTYTD